MLLLTQYVMVVFGETVCNWFLCCVGFFTVVFFSFFDTVYSEIMITDTVDNKQ